MEALGPPPRRRDARLTAPVPLTSAHDTSNFDCGTSVLDDWLKQRALKNESRFSRTYVVCANDRVVAYISLSAGSIERATAPGSMRRNAPDAIPVSIIGRLAVDRSEAGHGLGAALLADGLTRIAAASKTIGIRAVLVHAKDDRAAAFYKSCAEFIEYPADSRKLFIPIETLIATFG